MKRLLLIAALLLPLSAAATPRTEFIAALNKAYPGVSFMLSSSSLHMFGEYNEAAAVAICTLGANINLQKVTIVVNKPTLIHACS